MLDSLWLLKMDIPYIPFIYIYIYIYAVVYLLHYCLLAEDGSALMDTPGAKALISLLTGIPELVMADHHPEVTVCNWTIDSSPGASSQ